MNNYIIGIVVFVVCYLIGLVFILRWVYKDAKARNMNSVIWVLAFLFFTPRTIVLIAYILFRKQNTTIHCSNCDKKITTEYTNFCPQCGIRIDEVKSDSYIQSSYKSLILGGVIMIASEIAFICYFFAGFMNFNSRSIQIETSSSNIRNEWHYKFHYLQGKVDGNFIAKKDDSNLIYSSDIEKGTINFELYNEKDSLLTSFQANNKTDTIKNLAKGYYKVKVMGKKAQGKFDMIVE